MKTKPIGRAFHPILAGISVMTATVVAAGDPKNPGDVMGRDLNYTGFERLGHLGIFGGSRVLECLNEKTPIQKNTVESFKSLTSYWGARYIPGKHDFLRVVATGWAQRHYEPAFTMSPVYTVGRYANKRVWNSGTKTWERKTVLVPARFRCDTFVYYSFKAGIGYKLADGEILPRIIFNNCAKAR